VIPRVDSSISNENVLSPAIGRNCFGHSSPCVLRAQLSQLPNVDEHAVALKPVHAKLIMSKANTMEFCYATNLAVANTWFKKGYSNPVTYESGGCPTMFDYILICQNEKSTVRNLNCEGVSRGILYTTAQVDDMYSGTER